MIPSEAPEKTPLSRVTVGISLEADAAWENLIPRAKRIARIEQKVIPIVQLRQVPWVE